MNIIKYIENSGFTQATDIMEVLKQESDFPALKFTSFVESKLKFGETGGRDIIV